MAGKNPARSQPQNQHGHGDARHYPEGNIKHGKIPGDQAQ
jgi:hypothetical protein